MIILFQQMETGRLAVCKTVLERVTYSQSPPHPRTWMVASDCLNPWPLSFPLLDPSCTLVHPSFGLNLQNCSGILVLSWFSNIHQLQTFSKYPKMSGLDSPDEVEGDPMIELSDEGAFKKR
jgi:hypothetical protein